MIITAQYVTEETLRLLHAISPLIRKWATPFNSVEVADLAMKFGLATPEGHVRISSRFIGTDSEEALRETILHELTHLAIGLHHAHKRIFWRSLDALITQAGVDQGLAKTQKQQLSESTLATLRYRLVAICEDGSEVEIGMFQKKHRKYTDYNPASRRLCIDRKSIREFIYEDNLAAT